MTLSLDQPGSHCATRPNGRLTPDAKRGSGRAVREARGRVRAAWSALHVGSAVPD